ncbi:M16 family metallopeptidase [Mastigocoleus testarum]|uniref:Peptidase M16 n=1 Tax=Mastigocoleus testarum BC008 TaxID=371196 RepID=A0A0V8A0S4_9CYAN|nr:pitrilysin family protein [Mastigocoleus testarum]KST70299.1 peptidase M16 [Mastigocoleus testarum BC008]
MTSTLLKFPRLNAPKVHRLSNGLTILAEQIPVEAVNLSLWSKVGSAVETDTINGMAHFLEHMVFKGTQRLVAGEFERRVEERGGVTNAATSQDYTYYYITTAPKDFADLAPLQVDVVINPTIADDAFERERLVVLEEIRRSEDNPRRRSFRRAMELAYENLPYRRPVLGPESIISQLKPQQMRDFHNHWYQPDAITAVAVGNLPEEELIDILKQGFEDVFSRKEIHLPQSTNYNSDGLIGSKKLDSEKPFTEIIRQEFIDENLQQARLMMLWRVPGLNQLELTFALDVLAGVLGQGLTSRLVRDLREEQGLVSYISASNMTNKWQGTFYISAHCSVENLPLVEAAIVKHIARLSQETIQESEIARVRKRVANRFIFANEKPSDRAGLYGYYQTLLDNLEVAFDYPNYIQAQETNDLMEAAQKYLSPEAYGVISLKPAV